MREHKNISETGVKSFIWSLQLIYQENKQWAGNKTKKPVEIERGNNLKRENHAIGKTANWKTV